MADFLITLLLFASMEVVSKPLMGVMDPLALTFWRFTAGALILFALLGRRRGLSSLGSLSGGTLGLLAVMGVVNIAVAMALLQTAVKLTSAARAATVFCANPVMVFGISVAVGAEKPTGRKLLGLITGLAGLALTSGVHTMTVDTGTIYAMISAAAFASYTVIGRRVSGRTDPVTINAVSFTAGVLVLLPVLAFTGRPLSPAPLARDPLTLASALYLTAGVSGLAYLTFIRAIRKMGAVAASMVFMLKPAVASLLAIVFLGERLSPAFWAGLALTMLGSRFVMKGAR